MYGLEILRCNLIILNTKIVSLESYIVGTYSVNIQFKNCFDNFSWLLSGVYGPCSVMERKLLWKELKLMNCIWELPWCICGDFSEVRFMRERKDCTRISRGMKDFNKFCDELELIHLPTSGGKFTWTTTANNQPKSLIDRFLVNSAWEDNYPSIAVSALAKPFSDHKPIFLSCDLEDWGPPPFRCEAMWFLDPTLMPLMKEWWNSFYFFGSPGFVLSKKLMALKAELKRWNKEVFGRIDRKCEKALLDIAILDQLGDDEVLSTPQVCERNAKKLEFESLSDMKYLHWLGKSRMQWQEDGDRNTKFFHRITKSRRRRNTFAKLKIEHSWVEDKQMIKDNNVNHFQNRFACFEDYRADLSGMNLNSIDATEKALLEREISEEEVLSALKKLGQDRAPDPDGFQVNVIIKCWDFMKRDVMKVVKVFERNGSIDWRLESTFISLIPKKEVVEEVKDLRPISLTGSIYKAISKVLAERLKTVLPKLISKQQSAFVKGRQILDSILIANECMDSRLKSKIPGIICKIDLEKAFHNVKWSFVDEVLVKMGFGATWRMWIAGCIKRIPFSVLVNGSSCGRFTSQKGLRQGNPLSPFLFLLVSEVLTTMFTKATEMGWMGGFEVKEKGTKISHLQFSDDTLVFLDADINQIRYLKYNLLLFEYVSGLKTNFSKSNIFAVGDVINLDNLAEVFGCSVAAFLSTYLGLPLGEKSLSCSKWDRIVELCKIRLASWKKGLLSKAGKLTLIRSVLLSIPVYYFSLFMCPNKVISKIEKIFRDFLWHDMDNRKKHHWVRWNRVCQPFRKGGLAIRSLKKMNRSLLMKWWWRLGKEEHALWEIIIKEK